jgi:hypothetical protein
MSTWGDHNFVFSGFNSEECKLILEKVSSYTLNSNYLLVQAEDSHLGLLAKRREQFGKGLTFLLFFGVCGSYYFAVVVTNNYSLYGLVSLYSVECFLDFRLKIRRFLDCLTIF